MIAISSFRPFPKCTPQIAQNQIRAFKSWLTAFERVIYLGAPCSELCSIITEFVPAEDRPSIRKMAYLASKMGTWVALINADIVISKPMMPLQSRMDQAGIKCAITRRYDLESGFITDWGLDCFLGTQEVWDLAYRMIPPDFKIGFGQWDSFLTTLFVTEFGRRCADVTSDRFCHHPQHESRLNPNWDGPGLRHRYATIHAWPTTILK